jgi:hypothetical protein
VAPVALGCFAEVSTYHRLATDSSPGAWTAAVAVRDVVLHPVTPALAVPLGIDMTRAAYLAVRDVVTRLGAASWLRDESPIAPLLSSARDVASGRRDLDSVLGFDPLALLRHWMGRDEGGR